MMRDVPENELFSAYLDGELSAAEQAQVEELLARSPRARQLLDELRALSSTLQSLPPHKLDEDLSERVVGLAERRMLCERPGGRGPAPPPAPSPREAQPASAPSTSLPPPEHEAGSRLRRMLSPRALGWSIMAVAVALLIMAFEPERPERDEANRDVARAPDAAAESAPHGGEGPVMRAPKEAGDEDDDEEARGERAAADEAGDEEMLKRGERDRGVAAKAPAGPPSSGAAGPAPAAEPAPADMAADVPMERQTAAKPDASVGGLREADRPATLDKTAEVQDLAEATSPPAEMPAPAVEPLPTPEMPAPAPAPPAEPGESAVADSATADSELAPPRQPSAEEPAPSFSTPESDQLAANGHRREIGKVQGKAPGGAGGAVELAPGRRGGAGAGQGGGATQFGAASRAFPQDRAGPAPGDAVLLVHCDVTPGAVYRQVFDRLLAEKGIRLEQAESKARDGQRALDRRAAEMSSGQKKQEYEGQSAQRPPAERADDAPAAGPVELVYVEASHAQIESILSSLKGRPEEFLTVSVKPAPGTARQMGFSYRYNREQAESAQAEQTRKPEPAEGAGAEPAAEPEPIEDPAQSAPQRPLAEELAPGSSQLAAPRGRAQRLSLPGDEPAAGSPVPGLGRSVPRRDGYDRAAPRVPPETPGEPSAADADKKPAEGEAYRVLFVLRTVPTGDVASQAGGGNGPDARAAEAAAEAAAEVAAPAETESRPAADGAPPP